MDLIRNRGAAMSFGSHFKLQAGFVPPPEEQCDVEAAEVYFIGPDHDLQVRTPQEIVDGLEEGRFDLDTPLRPSPQRRASTVRHYLRDLVFQAHRQNRDRFGQEEPETPCRRVFMQAPLPFAISDLSGHLTQVNDALCDLLGRDAESLLGSLVGELSHPDDRDEEIRLGNELFAGRRNRFTVAKRFFHATGEAVPCRVHVALLRDREGNPEAVLATIYDRHPQLALDAMRATTAEVAAVEGMAKRLAHDFGNALLVIGTAAELLEESDGLKGTDREEIAAIAEATELCSQMVRQLRELATTGFAAGSALDLGEALRGRANLLRGLVGRDVDFSMEIPDCPLPAHVNSSALDRVLLNLVSNAVQHTPSGGRIAIAVEAHGCGTSVHVRDSGSGMTDEVRERALQPFFTARDGGTGLGLAIVNAAVTRWGGTVSIESAPGAGTTVSVHLPPVAPQ